MVSLIVLLHGGGRGYPGKEAVGVFKSVKERDKYTKKGKKVLWSMLLIESRALQYPAAMHKLLLNCSKDR